MTTPSTLTFPASDAQILAIRAKLGIPASETSGKYDTDQASLYFHAVPGGFEVDVLELKGFMASHAPESVVRQHIAAEVGLT